MTIVDALINDEHSTLDGLFVLPQAVDKLNYLAGTLFGLAYTDDDAVLIDKADLEEFARLARLASDQMIDAGAKPTPDEQTMTWQPEPDPEMEALLDDYEPANEHIMEALRLGPATMNQLRVRLTDVEGRALPFLLAILMTRGKVEYGPWTDTGRIYQAK